LFIALPYTTTNHQIANKMCKTHSYATCYIDITLDGLVCLQIIHAALCDPPRRNSERLTAPLQGMSQSCLCTYVHACVQLIQGSLR
jgi:hypothetical protein